MDEISAQTVYMVRNGIETLEDLHADRARLEDSLEALTGERTRLQNKIRRASPESKETLKRERAALTAQITQCRKALKANMEIEKRSVHIQETLDHIYDNELRAQQARTQDEKRGYER